MKSRIFVSVVCLFIFCLIIGNTGADPQPEKRVMNFLAVMDLNCGTALNKENCVALTNVVIDELVKLKKYTVIDRANRDKILAEAGFQQTGCVDNSCTIEMGRQLGVGKLVVGSITKIGETYLINVQLLNVETAAVETSARERCDKCKQEDLIDTVTNTIRKLMGEEPVPTSSGGTQPQTPTVKPGEMVSVPAGEFMMGCNAAVDSKCEKDEKPYHKVYLDAFYIDKYDVTVQQYSACVQSGKCTKPDDGGNCNWGVSGRENHPINCVDWNQSETYCESVGKKLPTEAQWEKAARGTDGRKYPWGNQEPTCDLAVFNSGNNHGCGRISAWPVGSKPAGVSPYGAMDMAGNAWNWVSDWYDENYYQSSPNRNPTGPGSGTARVVRGGNWFLNSYGIRSSDRNGLNPSSRNFISGLRCAKNK